MFTLFTVALAADAPLVWEHAPPPIAVDLQVRSLAVDDGRVFFAGSDALEAWSLATERRLWHVAVPRVQAVVPAPGGLLTIDVGGDVTLRDAQTGAVTRVLGHLASWPLAVAVSPDGEYAAAAGIHGDLGVWTLSDGAPIAVRWADGAPTRLEGLAFAGDRLFVAGILAGAEPAGVVDLRSGAARAVVPRDGAPGFAVATDGRRLAVGHFQAGRLAAYAVNDRLSRLWTREISANWAGPVAFADGALLVATPEGLLHLDPASGRELARFPSFVRTMAVANGEVFVVPEAEGRLRRLRLSDLAPLNGEAAGAVAGLAWSRDGRRLAVQTTLGVDVYDASGARIDGWPQQCRSAGGVRFDAAGERLATTGCGVATIATVGGERRAIPYEVTVEVWFDGRDVVIATFGGGVLTERGTPARDPRTDPTIADAVWGHRASATQHWLNTARFGPDRDRWLSGGFDLEGITTVERRRDGVFLRRGDVVVPLELGSPSALAVSPDGRRLAVGYQSGRLEVRALP
jgi:WD40 repeat protein